MTIQTTIHDDGLQATVTLSFIINHTAFKTNTPIAQLKKSI